MYWEKGRRNRESVVPGGRLIESSEKGNGSL